MKIFFILVALVMSVVVFADEAIDSNQVEFIESRNDSTGKYRKSEGKKFLHTQKNNGFKFSIVKEGSIFEKMGFKDGDVIKSYKGKPIKSAKDAMKMYSELMKNGNIDYLEIQR